MSKGAKIILLVIGVLLLCCGGLAVYALTLPAEQPASVQASTPEPTQEQTYVADAELAGQDAVETPSAEATAEPDKSGDGADELPEGVYNVMFIGSDSRTAVDDAAEGISDSMLVVSYDTKANKVTLVSFMRDSYVQRIGENASFKGKLNAAYKSGGATELIDTINLNFELGIKNYVAMGYDGFSTLIDEIGGIDLEITGQEAYYINWRYADTPQDAPKDKRKSWLELNGRPVLDEDYEGLKTQHLNGPQALWYSRDRTTDAADGTSGSDAVRTRRQQTVMMTVYKKVKSELTLDTVIALIKFATQHVETNMDIITMTKIATKALKAGDIQFVNVKVPFDGAYTSGTTPTGDYAIYFDIDAAAKQLREILYGTGN